MSHRQNSRISPSSAHCSYRFWTFTLSFCRKRSASHEECYRFAGFWEPEGLTAFGRSPYRFAYVKPQNANWVQDYMAVRSLLPVAHMLWVSGSANTLDMSED